MPFRPRRRTFRRFGRRMRTRWMSITPGSQAGLANNVFVGKLINMQTAGGVAQPWNNFVGDTVLRVILDLTASYTLDPSISGTLTASFGLLMTEDQAIDQVTWDPNVPSGDFMMRALLDRQVGPPAAAGGYTFDSQYSSGGGHEPPTSQARHLRINTTVRRRISENDQMWLAILHFIQGGVQGVDYGWTGRILLGLH